MRQLVKLVAAVMVCAMLALPNLAAAQTVPTIPPALITPDKIETRIGPLQFNDGAPSAETAEKVYDTLDFTRGLDAFSIAYGARPRTRSVRASSASAQRTTRSSFFPN